MSKPIQLYAWCTPNGYKPAIALEEMGLDYTPVPVNIGKGEQFEPDFLKISPNNRIPAIVDPHGPDGEAVSVFESGAILVYLAEKTGKFLPETGAGRAKVMEWLMWQMGGFGPMLGQVHHFKRYAPEKIPYAIDRYHNEGLRLYGVLDKQLAKSAYVAGDDYSIADMAIYPWAAIHDYQGIALDDFPHVAAWIEKLAARSGVQKGMALMQEYKTPPGELSDEARKALFGKSQTEKRD